MTDQMPYDLARTLNELDGGVFGRKASKAAEQVAAATVTYSKPGELTIKLKFKQIGNSSQVEVEHTLTYNEPTANGNVTEKNTTTTPMHVSQKGGLSLMPDTQTGFEFDKQRD